MAVRGELSQIRDQLANIPSVNVTDLENRIADAEERIEVESLSIKDERELNRKIQGWKVVVQRFSHVGTTEGSKGSRACDRSS